MIIEAGVLLCWVASSVQHCGHLNGYLSSTFVEVTRTSNGDVTLSCADGAMPIIRRHNPDIIGLYDAVCSGDVEPIRNVVQSSPTRSPEAPP